MQDAQRWSSNARAGAKHFVALVGLAVVFAGCSDSALSPSSPEASADVAPPLVLTHPNGTVTGTTPLDGEPYGVDVSINGTIYATQLAFNQVATSTLASQTINGEIAVGSTPTGVTFSPDGLTAYVTNQGSGTVGVIDVATNTQVATVATPDGSSPLVVIVSANGKQLFVGTGGTNVYVVNTHTLAVTDQIAVGGAANGFALSPNNKLMFVSSFTSGTVTEFVVKTHAIVQTFNPGGAPQGLTTNKHGTELYVVNEAGFVSLFDIATGTLITTLPLTAGGFGAAVTPDDNHLYLTEPDAGIVQIVNLKTRALKGTINVGGNPRRVAFSATGNMGVVTNLNGYLSFIQ
jgi:YVTN family beta-propeller protein